MRGRDSLRREGRTATGRRSRVFSPTVNDCALETRRLLSYGPNWTREEAVRFHQDVFRPLEDAPALWDGDVATGTPGTLGAEYQQVLLARINAYRAMAGAPAIQTIVPEWSAMAQQAALIVSANGQASHYPSPSSKLYTAAGALGAANSNLALGSFGVESIDGFIVDPGSSNSQVGHRSWLLHPMMTRVGLGDVSRLTHDSTTSQAVFVDLAAGLAPKETFIAWPPSGAFPASLVPDRWSLRDYGDGYWMDTSTWELHRIYDLSQVQVAATVDGVPQPVVVEYRSSSQGFELVFSGISAPRNGLTQDVVVNISIQNVLVWGVPKSYSYTTTLFSTDALDSVYADHGAEGVWRYNAAEGSRLITGADPEAMALGKNGTLYLDLGRFGLWSWNDFQGFQQLNAADPEGMEAGSDGSLYVDYGAFGLWRATSHGFHQLNAADPEGMKAGAYGAVFIDYGPFGLWRATADGRFQQLNAADPEGMEFGSDGVLYIDFGRFGLWSWEQAKGIRQLNGADPRSIATGAPGTLIVDFGPWGLWARRADGDFFALSVNVKNPEQVIYTEYGQILFDLGAGGLRVGHVSYDWLASASGMDWSLARLDPDFLLRTRYRGAGPLEVRHVVYIGYGEQGVWLRDELDTSYLHQISTRKAQAIVAM